MCSSRLDRESGIVTVTTPCSWAEPGHKLYCLWASESYGISHADWALRLLRPSGESNGNGKAWGVGVDTAEAELKLAMSFGLVHESLVEEPNGGDGQVSLGHLDSAASVS